MGENKLFFSLDPFLISYNSKTLPSTPEGSPTEINDFPDVLARELLKNVPYILSGKVCGLPFLDDPHYLIIIPWGGEISFLFRTSVTQYFKNGQHITVPSREFLELLLETTQSFIDDVEQGGQPSSAADLYDLHHYRNLAETLIWSHGYSQYKEIQP